MTEPLVCANCGQVLVPERQPDGAARFYAFAAEEGPQFVCRECFYADDDDEDEEEADDADGDTAELG